MTGTLTTEELEARMRPGAWSQAGFLGPRESLSAVLECDAAAVARQGLTHERLAGALEDVLERALRIRARTRRMDPPIIVGRFQVEIRSWLGTQNCPWPECATLILWGASMDWRIRRRDGAAAIAGPGLIVHLIRTHHFYEGRHSPYRVDPIALAATLDMLPPL